MTFKKGEYMINLQKSFAALIVMVAIVAISLFAVKEGPMKAASSQSPKLADNSVKAVKKRIIPPNQARNFLNDLDMPTRDYEDMGTLDHYGQYEADSDRLILETRDTDRFSNNLSYSVFGDKSVAKAVELYLNVNDISFSSNAVGELIKYSDNLIYKITGKHLTPEIKKAMLAKNKGQWVINGYKIKLEKEIFPDEKPIKGIESTSDHGAFSLNFIIEL